MMHIPDSYQVKFAPKRFRPALKQRGIIGNNGGSGEGGSSDISGERLSSSTKPQIAKVKQIRSTKISIEKN